MPFEASEAVFLVSIRLQNSRFCFSKSVYRSSRKKTRILIVSPESRSPFSASRLPDLCLTARAYLKTQKYGLFCSLGQYLAKTNQNCPKIFCPWNQQLKMYVLRWSTQSLLSVPKVKCSIKCKWVVDREFHWDFRVSFLRFSPAWLTESCSFWHGLKDLFPLFKLDIKFFPWPFKLMASQAAWGTWIRKKGYGQFKGEWVSQRDVWFVRKFRVSQTWMFG